MIGEVCVRIEQCLLATTRCPAATSRVLCRIRLLAQCSVLVSAAHLQVVVTSVYSRCGGKFAPDKRLDLAAIADRRAAISSASTFSRSEFRIAEQPDTWFMFSLTSLQTTQPRTGPAGGCGLPLRAFPGPDCRTTSWAGPASCPGGLLLPQTPDPDSAELQQNCPAGGRGLLHCAAGSRA